MMKCLMFLVLIAWTNARKLNKLECEYIKRGIVVNGIIHEKEVLKDNVDTAYQLAIDYSKNVLYFSYSLGDGAAFNFTLGSINLKTKAFNTINGVPGPFANAVDEKSHSVYFGGSSGISKLKPGTRTAFNIGITSKSIWQLFSKDGLYFTTYPEEEAYVYQDGKVSKVTGIDNTKVMLIGVDNSHNIIFYNPSGLFYHTKENGKTALIGDYVVKSIASDINGAIYFSTPNEIYIIDDKTRKAKILTRIDNIYGIAIEGDGSIIYASDKSIFRLRNTGKECITDLKVKLYGNALI